MRPCAFRGDRLIRGPIGATGEFDSPQVLTADDRSSRRNAVIAGFLGWTLDAFDFFILILTLSAVARDFHRPLRDVALSITFSLAMRPLGALIFGAMADRYGRRLPLMIDVVFYSALEVLSGLARSFPVFFVLRMLYGIGLGGEWGVSTSMVIEWVPVKWRGLVTGLLQQGYSFGSVLASIAYFLVFPRWGWRPLFFIGGLPALLVLFIRKNVKESEAWKRSRTDWSSYWSSIFRHWKIFLYLVLLLTMMNFAGHGTQDLYPTFLGVQRHLRPQLIAIINMISAIGAVCGGVCMGFFSDQLGRRKAMVASFVLALAVIPLWMLAPSLVFLSLGAFLMQFMVQGAFGVVASHINELSPDTGRGFFPGFAFQVGVLCASSITYFEAVLGERFSFQTSMATLAAVTFVGAIVVIALGPEAKGIAFGRQKEVPQETTT